MMDTTEFEPISLEE